MGGSYTSGPECEGTSSRTGPNSVGDGANTQNRSAKKSCHLISKHAVKVCVCVGGFNIGKLLLKMMSVVSIQLFEFK